MLSRIKVLTEMLDGFKAAWSMIPKIGKEQPEHCLAAQTNFIGNKITCHHWQRAPMSQVPILLRS